MSGTFSTWLETQLLNYTFGGLSFTPPAAVYVALYSTAPDVGGGGVEIAGGAYARQLVAFGPVSGVPPVMNNPNAIQWPAAGNSWGTIVAAALLDGLTGGNLLGSSITVDPTDGVTPKPITIGAGDVFRIPVNGLLVGFAAAGGMMAPAATRTLVGPIGAMRVGGAASS